METTNTAIIQPIIEDIPALKYWMLNEYEKLSKAVNMLERNHSPLRQSYHEKRLELIKVAAIVASLMFLAVVGSCALVILSGVIQSCHGP